MTDVLVNTGGSMTTKTKVIIGVVAAVVVLGGGLGLYFGLRKKPRSMRGLGGAGRTRKTRSLGCGCGG